MGRSVLRPYMNWARESLSYRYAGFVAPRRLDAGFVGKTCVGVFGELEFLVEDTGFDHEVADHIEVGFARSERTVGDAVERLGERPSQQRGLLIVVEAADEIGGVFAMWLARVEPQAGSRDAIDQGLDDFG